MKVKVLGTIGIMLAIVGAGFAYTNWALSLVCILAFGIVMKVAVTEWEKEECQE